MEQEIKELEISAQKEVHQNIVGTCILRIVSSENSHSSFMELYQCIDHEKITKDLFNNILQKACKHRYKDYKYSKKKHSKDDFISFKFIQKNEKGKGYSIIKEEIIRWLHYSFEWLPFVDFDDYGSIKKDINDKDLWDFFVVFAKKCKEWGVRDDFDMYGVINLGSEFHSKLYQDYVEHLLDKSKKCYKPNSTVWILAEEARKVRKTYFLCD